MLFCPVRSRLRADLRAGDMVVRLGVVRAVDHAFVPTDMLHDVDLALRRPAGLSIGAEHPDRRPYPAPAGQLRAHLDEGVRPLRMAARQQPGGRIGLPAIILGLGQRLAPRGDEQRSEEHTSELQSLMRRSYA